MRNITKTRILMVGPGVGIPSGISALIETLVPVLGQQVDLLHLPTVRQRPLKESGKILPKNIALAISQYARFLLALLRFHPHIVHLHTSEGLAWLKDTLFVLVSKACGCPIIVHVHAADFDELYGKRPRVLQYYTRSVMRLADAVIAVSTEWERRLASIVPYERISTFRNCITVDPFLFDISRYSTDRPRALFLGSVGPRKGAFDLLEAMGHLRSSNCPLCLWVAGYEEREGDLARARARLEELHLGDTCQLVGTVRGDRKAQLLSEASIFVLPSYNEGLPMAILEALVAGLAIVTTPVGGIPEVVKDGYNGFLVAPGDVERLAEKLAALANDRRLRKAMGQRGREIAEKELDVKPYVSRLVALYESLVSL